MKDNWCKPFKLEDNRTIYGGAARNARIKQGGGCKNFCKMLPSKQPKWF